MIRIFEQQDMDPVLDIWLRASIKAHDFIDAAYWQAHVATMREVYIPASETYVIADDSKVLGFCSLLDNQLAALFVDPDYQGQGLGKRLLGYAKSIRDELTLAVYTENTSSLAFYLAQGFKVTREQVDEQTGRGEYLMAYSS